MQLPNRTVEAAWIPSMRVLLWGMEFAPLHAPQPSLACGSRLPTQDVSGGMPVMLEGTELPLWALEIDPEREKAKFKAYTAGGRRGGIGCCSVDRHRGFHGSRISAREGWLLNTCASCISRASGHVHGPRSNLLGTVWVLCLHTGQTFVFCQSIAMCSVCCLPGR